MAALAREIGETVNLAILDRTEILVLHAVESPHEFRMAAKVGGRRPFYVTALGKASAAFLAKDDLEALLGSLTIPLEHSTPNSIQNSVRLRQELNAVRLRGYVVDNEEAVLGAPFCPRASSRENDDTQPTHSVQVGALPWRGANEKVLSLAFYSYPYAAIGN
jgi:DNA-binding IclR family transcriptional regulator